MPRIHDPDARPVREATGPDVDCLDVHHHAFTHPGDIADAAMREGLSPEEYVAHESSQRIALMDAKAVRNALVIPSHGYPRSRGLEDTRLINDGIAAYRDARPRRFPLAVGVVEPRDRDASFDELERCKTELGLAGISFHARYQGVSLDDDWIIRYLERMGELGLVPLLHAVDETPDEALWRVGMVAAKLPELTILVMDGYATFDGTRHCAWLAETYPNLIFDTSLVRDATHLIPHIARFGAHRYAFGTDCYSWPHHRSISHVKDELEHSTLSGAAVAEVLGGTARRLFGLDEVDGSRDADPSHIGM